MTPLRVAVLGGGHLGRIHTRLLKSQSGFEVVAVADPLARTRQQIEEEFNVRTVPDYHVLTGEIDAVVIACPTSLHYSAAMWSLKHGLHTFVEKPLVKSSHEASELNQLARKQGCVLQVGHVEQFNPAWTSACDLIDRPQIIEAVRESTYTGRSTDIGVVLDLMIHDLDLIVSVVDSAVMRVDAKGWSLMGQHEDLANARIEFENGCVANVRASRVSRNATRRMQLLSKRSMIDIDFATSVADVVAPHSAVLSRQWQADTLPNDERLKVKDELFTKWLPHTKLQSASVNAIELELRDFLRAIQTGGLPRVTGEHAERVLQLAEQVLFSIRSDESLGHERMLEVVPMSKRKAA